MMSFTQAVKVCLREKFATFSGRASRSEYWWFVLFNVLVGIVTSILDAVFGTEILLGTDKYGNPQILGIITTIVGLGLLIPCLAVCFRRLHDRNKSGWYAFLPFILVIVAAILAGIPILALILAIAAIGATIYLFVMLILKGDNGRNDYGPDPLNPNSNSSIF
ncbi:MAG: DUF805 domain-containing protein [Campylobacter sp.]|nr:DUF805 domain-containing protein [Campylobacter sp.]